jgi:hypothetical protein
MTPEEEHMWQGLGALGVMPAWLAGLDDSQRVQRALSGFIPDLRSAKLGRVRLKSGRWTARCRVVLGDEGQQVDLAGTIIPPGEEEPEFDTLPRGRPGTQGWRCWIPDLRLALESKADTEAELPAMGLLTDPDRARSFLEEAIRAGSPKYRDLRIVSAKPKVMRYSPGSRCTVLYRLEFPSEPQGNWPQVVVAKTYRGADKGRIAWEGMNALWNSPMVSSGVVEIAEPLAWVPEQKILVQGPVREERTLKALLLAALSDGDGRTRDQLHTYLSKTAAGLVQLHHSGATSAERTTWGDELAEVREVLSRLAAVLPRLDGAAEPFLDELERLAHRFPPDVSGPAHRSFRPAQVLLYKGSIGFIDFDGFCLCEPAIDVALFRATTRDLAINTFPANAPLEERLETIDGLCEHFLASYEVHSPISRERVALWESLDLMTNVLHSWTKAKPRRLVHALELLRHHNTRLDTLLAET